MCEMSATTGVWELACTAENYRQSTPAKGASKKFLYYSCLCLQERLISDTLPSPPSLWAPEGLCWPNRRRCKHADRRRCTHLQPCTPPSQAPRPIRTRLAAIQSLRQMFALQVLHCENLHHPCKVSGKLASLRLLVPKCAGPLTTLVILKRHPARKLSSASPILAQLRPGPTLTVFSWPTVEYTVPNS